MMNADTPIPVVLGIDVEPDERLPDRRRPQPWRGFERLHAFMTDVRAHLAARHGTRLQFVWFIRLDPQIGETYGDPAWALKHYERQVAAMVAAGDEVGVHAHAYRWQPSRNTWIVDTADEQWVDQCITTAFRAFESGMHRAGRAHKFGDRWLSNRAIATLEALGAHVDLTLEPGVTSPVTTPDEVHTAQPPDYTDTPRRVYRPAPENFRLADRNGRRLWLLPLSTCQVPFSVQLPRRLYHRLRPAPDGPVPGDESSRATVTIRPGLRPYLFRLLTDRLLADRETAHLGMVFRSSDGIKPAQLRRIATNVTALVQHPLADRFRFVGPEAAVEILQPVQPAHDVDDGSE